MLVTLEFYNSVKIANHNLDSTATFIDRLEFTGLSIKRGITVDTASLTVSRSIMNDLNLALVCLVMNTPVKVSFYDLNTGAFKPALDGYVAKMANKGVDEVTLSIESKVSFHSKQFFVPTLDSSCQNQVYSKMCGLNRNLFKATSPSITIDCLTGAIDYTTDFSSVFGDIDNIYLAHIVLGGFFKTRVISIDRLANKFYVLLNYYDMSLTTSITAYLYCNKTFGMCHTRFNNVKSFYGFPSIGQGVKTFNIFSATNITYCGQDIAVTDIASCSSDTNLFGIQL